MPKGRKLRNEWNLEIAQSIRELRCKELFQSTRNKQTLSPRFIPFPKVTVEESFLRGNPNRVEHPDVKALLAVRTQTNDAQALTSRGA